MSELEEDAGAGNTETAAWESTQKFLLERESLRFRQGEKTFLPTGQLVFQPGAWLLALLGFASMILVEPACGGDGI